MVQRIVDIAVGTFRNILEPNLLHPLVDEFQHVCRDLVERDLERVHHQRPPPGVAAPPPRVTHQEAQAIEEFVQHNVNEMIALPEIRGVERLVQRVRDAARPPRATPQTVAESEAIVDAVHGVGPPMTATEVRRRQEEHVADVQEHARRQAQRRAQAQAETGHARARRRAAEAAQAGARAMVDLGTVGMAALEVRPGQVMRIDPRHFNVGDYAPELRGRDSPEPLHQARESQARAKAILWEHLNPEQREQLFLLDFFAVKGSKSGKIYRIANASTGNVIREDGVTYCLVPEEAMPQWDQLLAQKLMIEDNEKRFIRLAKRQDQIIGPAELRHFAHEVAEVYAQELRGPRAG